MQKPRQLAEAQLAEAQTTCRSPAFPKADCSTPLEEKKNTNLVTVEMVRETLPVLPNDTLTGADLSHGSDFSHREKEKHEFTAVIGRWDTAH